MYKKIALITSGGDAPGMNAAIRAVTRTAIANDLEVLAVYGGYEGLIDGSFQVFHPHSVSNIIQRGGTILSTSRSERFLQKEFREQAYKHLKRESVDAAFLIGGNGSLAGAHIFTSEFDIPFIGIPKTIDNDVFGTDQSIGFDTAINTAMEAIDRIRDTASSHHRLFFIEVMGRNLGFIAASCGIAAGAEAILVPEVKTNIDDLISKLETGWKRHKSSMIVVVAEGAVKGGVQEIAEKVKERFDHYDIRVSILGHIQRGGNPSCFDRLLAGRLGYEAVMALLAGKKNVLVGISNNEICYTPLEKASKGGHTLDKKLLLMSDVLSS